VQTRTALLGSVLALGVTVAGPAAFAAAPKPVCKLVNDAKGDTASPAPDAALDSQLDIVSADVATDRRNLTVVLRLAALTQSDAGNPQGRIYEFDFTAAEKNFILMGSLLPGGNDFGVYTSDQRLAEGESGGRAATGIGTAFGVVDTAKKEVRITASLDVFAPYARLSPNTTIYNLAAFTYRANGLAARPPGQVPVNVTGSFGLGVDEAWGRRTYYRAGAPSCVRVGR
jgi:hypothetical protein